MKKFMTRFKAWLGLAYYTSELDQFLQTFDQSHPGLSLSQRKEVQKFARLNALRDNVQSVSHQPSFWNNF